MSVAIILSAFTVYTATAFVPNPIRPISEDMIRPKAGGRFNKDFIPKGVGMSLAGQDIIEAGVSFDTFAPQFLWLSMIVAPESSVTKKIMGPIVPILALSLVHLGIVVLAASQKGAVDQILIFGEVFDPSLSQLTGMQKLLQFPNFVAEEWPHVLIWDLFVGRAVWLDGVQRGIDTRLSLSFCNFIGPPGLLIYAATCLITGKGLPAMGYSPDSPDDEIEQ